MRRRSACRPSSALPLLLILACPALAVEPGVDIAAPRVAISLVNNTLQFHPANLVVELGDHVRWLHSGTLLVHTTTSGVPCTANGLWAASLSPGQRFTRQFLEVPGTIDYFCNPHCLSGM